jgi:Transferrin receptor-like dimerisation domain
MLHWLKSPHKTPPLGLNIAAIPYTNLKFALIYAPGFYTGYGVKTLPGVREAIEQKRWGEADAQIARVSKALQSEADLLDEAAKQLGTK